MEEFTFNYNILIFTAAFLALGFGLELDVRQKLKNKLGYFFILLYFILLAIIFGFRDISIGSDTQMYSYQYENYKEIDMGTDFLTYYIFSFLNLFSKDPVIFYLTMSTLYLSTIAYAFRNFSKKFKVSPYLLIFSLMSFFFFLAMGINIIRQGVAIGFFAIGFSYYLVDSTSLLRRKILIPFIISIGFHFTILIPITFIFLIVFFDKIKLVAYTSLYFIALALSAFNVSILFVKDYIAIVNLDERRSSYFETDNFSEDYSIGFKPQFVAFNTIFLLLFFLIDKYVQSTKESRILLKYYMLSSALFFMVFQLPYSDRWGIMSWIVIPFLMAPLFSLNSSKKFATFAVLYLIFIFIFFQVLIKD